MKSGYVDETKLVRVACLSETFTTSVLHAKSNRKKKRINEESIANDLDLRKKCLLAEFCK